MRKLFNIGVSALQGFITPVFNFLIVIFGVKNFGKYQWGSLINVMLWVFLIVFILAWGNRDYLLRKYAQEPSKVYRNFYRNFFSRSLLLPFSLFLFLFFPLKIAFWAVLLVFLNFVYASLNTLVIYHQKFVIQLLAEVVAFVVVFCGVFNLETFDLESFLKIYLIAILLKTIVLGSQLCFFKEAFYITLSVNELGKGLPFFMLSLSGWLVSKIDIFLVDFYLDSSQLSEYQLLITAFLMLQVLSAYIILPFTKHVYRVPNKVLKKIKTKLYIASVPLTITGGFVIWLVMEYYVKLGFDYKHYIVGCFMALPSYFYTLDITIQLRNQNEKTILRISSFCFLITILLIISLIGKYQIFGVLVSVCIVQWLVLLIYKLHEIRKVNR